MYVEAISISTSIFYCCYHYHYHMGMTVINKFQSPRIRRTDIDPAVQEVARRRRQNWVVLIGRISIPSLYCCALILELDCVLSVVGV
jgi:hypothetical protein